MTAIAQELDSRLRTLDATKAARCEQLVSDVLALLDESAPTNGTRSNYVTRTYDTGLMPGIDPTKLGQLADEI